MRSLVVVAFVTLSAAAHAKPGAILIPPIEAAYGAAAPVGEATPLATSTELRVGAHWASLAWKPTRFDVGVGYLGSFRTLPGPSTLARTADAISIDAEPELRLHGMYLSLAYAIESHRHWRTWVGGSIDTLRGDYQGRSLNAVGGSIRLGAEIFAAGAHGAGGGNAVALMAGAWALGIYVEGSARTLPDELGPVGVGAGVSMRVPFLLAVGS